MALARGRSVVQHLLDVSGPGLNITSPLSEIGQGSVYALSQLLLAFHAAAPSRRALIVDDIELIGVEVAVQGCRRCRPQAGPECACVSAGGR